MEIKGSTHMNKIIRNTLITAAAIAACTIGTKANSSEVYHIQHGVGTGSNDGKALIVFTDGKKTYCLDQMPESAYPVRGGQGEMGYMELNSGMRGVGVQALNNSTAKADQVAKYNYSVATAHNAYVSFCF